MSCLTATRAAEAAERRARLADLALALRAAPQDLERELRTPA